MSNILTPAERIARIINLLDPYGIWYFLNVENEEAGDTRVTIHLEYCVVHPDDINAEDDEDSRRYIHDMYVDWMRYNDETFVRKLDEVADYLKYCNLLEHQDNYSDMTPRQKADFVENELEKSKKKDGDRLPF